MSFAAAPATAATSTRAPTRSTTTVKAGTSAFVTGSTSAIPESALVAPAQVTWFDVAATRRSFGLKPSAANELDELVAFAFGGLPSPGAALSLRHPEAPSEMADRLGFRWSEIDGIVEFGLPPESVTVLHGRFSVDRVTKALLSDSVLKVGVTRSTEHGFTLLIREDALRLNVRARSPLFDLGRFPNLAVRGDTIVVAHTEEGIDSVIERLDAARTPPSSAAHRRLHPLVATVKGMHAALLYLSKDTVHAKVVVSGMAVPAGTKRPSKVGDPVKGAFVIAGLHDDATAAKAGLGALETLVRSGTSARSTQKWSELVPGAKVTQEGPVLVVRASSVRTGLWSQVVFNQDSLYEAV